MSSGRRAAVFLGLGGLAVLYGSSVTWDVCPKIPCEGPGGLLSLFERSGIEIGPGIVTAELGLLLAMIGVNAFRRGGTSPFRIEAVALAVSAVLAVAVYLVRTYILPEFFTYGPDLGVYVVAGGAVVAAFASWQLPRSDSSSRAWAEARRVPLALLVAGGAVWILALRGHLGVRIEPLAFALVLISLGVGLWPTGLPITRLKSVTVGVLIAIYGVLALGGIVLGQVGLLLLEAAPIVVAVALLGLAVLELPTETPRAEGPEGRIDGATTAIGTKSGLLVAGLILTGVALILLISRLLHAGGVWVRLSLIDDAPTDPQWLVWLLAAGLAIGTAIAVKLARRTAG